MKIKRKGAFEYNVPWHANHSMLVVPKAAEAALIHGKDVEEFILNHADKYDFMLRTKVPRSSRLVGVDEDGNDYALQNVTRYYIAKEGLSLVKIMPPLQEGGKERRIGINTGWKVKVCNDINDFKWNIDYEFYVKEAKKLVDPILNS